MAFLVMIMVGFASLTRVEIQVAANYQKLDQARQNALYALNLAVGELQAVAGNDQRITARAEILDSTPDTSDITGVNQPYWTGVWKTGAVALDVAPSGSPQRQISLGSTNPTPERKSSSASWLVSKPASTTVVDPINGPSGPTVTLASQIGEIPTDINVPRVDIIANASGAGPTTVGRYAYWVADEGVKAKVNLIDPTMGAPVATTRNQAHFLAPQANAIHKIAGLTNSSSTDFRTENTAFDANTSTNINLLTRVLTLNQLAFLPSSPSGLNLKRYLPDITAFSKGVLADVKNGGLKKDLTAALETGTEYTKLTTRYSYGSQQYPMLYADDRSLTVPYTGTAATPYTTFNAIGLPWLNFYTYYNLYKSTLPPPPGITVATTKPVTTTGSISNLPYSITPRTISQRENSTNVAHDGIMPEMLFARMDIALMSILDGGVYKLVLRYYPQLVLHNPYNCRISTNDFRYLRQFGAFNKQGGGNKSVSIDVWVNGAKVTTAPLDLNKAGSTRFDLQTRAGHCDTLGPGETRIFGLTTDVPRSNASGNMSASINCTNLVGGGNTSSQAAQWCYLITNNNDTAAAVLYPGTTNKDAIVKVELYDGNGLVTALSDFRQTTKSNLISDFQWPTPSDFAVDKGRIRSTGGVSVINNQDPWPDNITIDSIKDNPRILAGFTMRKKGLFANDPNYFNGSKATPLFHGNAPLIGPFESYTTQIWQEYYSSKFGAPYLGSSDVMDIGGRTYYGNAGAGSGSGSPQSIVLRDVPSQPLISLGQFMHMGTNSYSEGQRETWATNYGTRSTGSMFIGGSLANPFISTQNNALNYNPGGSNYRQSQLLLDDSYLANDTLFDRFYLSTVPPVAPNSAPIEWVQFNSQNPGSVFVDDTVPLLNTRMKPYSSSVLPPAMADLRDFDKAAANLLLDGAFNVNSTSVNAWKSLLASLSGLSMHLYSSTSGSVATINKNTLANVIPRFWSSANNGEVNKAWEGNRALSDGELDQLAASIVAQVKMRGPFLSMSDFLNRRLGGDSVLTRMGALQAAIDNAPINDMVKQSGMAVNLQDGDAGVPFNEGIGISPSGPSIIGSNLIDAKGDKLSTTVGMPGYLMQQDIVQAFSSAMTVRSDTFVIRTYGETVNPATGETQAKAWAEAVVQRVPDFVDPNDPGISTLGAATDPAILNAVNKFFGRRFKVINFRWMNSNEI